MYLTSLRAPTQADRSPGDAAGDGAPAGLSPGQVGLLVDWLELLEPEVISSCPDTQLQVRPVCAPLSEGLCWESPPLAQP